MVTDGWFVILQTSYDTCLVNRCGTNLEELIRGAAWPLTCQLLTFPIKQLGTTTNQSGPKSKRNIQPQMALLLFFNFTTVITIITTIVTVRRPWGACWMVAEGGEGENPLPFSLTAPKRGGGWGRGGIPASFPSRSPPPKQPFQPTPTPSPGSHQEVCEQIVILGKRPQAPGGPGPKPWGPGPQAPSGDLAHRPLGPVSRHSHWLTSCKLSSF